MKKKGGIGHMKMEEKELYFIYGGGIKQLFSILTYHLFKMVSSYFRAPRIIFK